MFNRRRKPSGNLVYADASPRELSPKKPRRRLAHLVLAIAAAAIVLMAAVTAWYAYRDLQDHYDRAQALLAEKEYTAAMDELEVLGNFRDSKAILTRLNEQQAAYDTAADLVAQQRYSEAITAFRALGDYADSAQQAAYQVTYQKALDLLWEIDMGKQQLLTRILAEQVRLTDENSYPTTVGYEAAAALLESLGDYKSAPALVDRCYYSAGLVKLSWNDWEGALAYVDRMTPDTAAEFLEEYQQRYHEYSEEEGP